MINKKSLILILVFLIPLIASQGIEVDYPSQVSLDEEFSFKIKLIDFYSDIYDVKIDILVNDNRIAKILNNDQWKSTYYYVNDIINESEEKTFLMKIIEDFDEAEIIIKIKDSVNQVESFTGYSIQKNSNEETGEENLTQEIESDESQEEPDEDEEDSESEIIEIVQSNKEEQSKNSKVLETINLNTKKNTEELDKSDYALYGLGIFSLIIIILFLLRKNKFKNEFR